MKIVAALAAGSLALAAPVAIAQDEATGTGAGIEVVENVEGMQIQSMEIDGINAFLQDIVSSDDPDAPMTCGMFRLEASSEPLTYDYDYDEAKIVLDGVLTVSDGTNTVDAKAGDVVFIPKGTNVSFTTESSGLAFVCGQRARDGA